ncbi:hypothetical protein [Streptomyces buecherae]|uniref:hypothetical protein n=1 Tax=Streptomyces buecherae TaxID=2763006 RepID=UPI0037AC1771
MDMGDLPAWVALGLSAAALAVSYAYGKRSADAADESAAAAVASLALQRAEAEERRRAAEPKVDLVLEHIQGTRYRVRNRGAATAPVVQFLDQGRPYLFDWPRDGVTIAADDSHPLTMAGAGSQRMPVRLLVTWEGQDEPVPLQIPPRR